MSTMMRGGDGVDDGVLRSRLTVFHLFIRFLKNS